MRIVAARGFADGVDESKRIAVADSIASVVDALVPGDPPFGDRPIHLIHGVSPLAFWADEDFFGSVYRVRISSTGTRFQQFAYQVAHELGHIKFGPARSNVLLEIFAEMVSLAAMRGVGDAWRQKPPYIDGTVNWMLMATTVPYIQNAARLAADNLPPSIRLRFTEASVGEKANRLASIRADVERLPLIDAISRAYQQAWAHLIIDTEQPRWSDLLGIGLQTDPPPKVSLKCTDQLPLRSAAIPKWVPRFLL
ncbi:hypothetical protein [Lacipirellula parvula]|uniref:Uncharacterized protein n=1 Tax=Lacipirellula parvula TaxID=2650471 RepID=A0A5K7X736_9BACT|nr:hypothetical protein [Lacipirellula parvula]BBO30541.1 hypothetical protein PLANPX_0153 [Lacipirellula parvula]